MHDVEEKAFYLPHQSSDDVNTEREDHHLKSENSG
jgi:hypothetical protein